MLELYTKGADVRSLEPAKRLFGDTVRMYGSDGTSNFGSKEEVMARNKANWDKYTSFKTIYHSFVSLKIMDRDDTWFIIWYKFIKTDKKGKTDSTELIENWKLNKDLKVTELYQYEQQYPALAKK